MAIINVRDLSIEQLTTLLNETGTVLNQKIEAKRQERENILNNHWDALQTVIKQYESNYTVMMRVKDNNGHVRYFEMNGDANVNFELGKKRQRD